MNKKTPAPLPEILTVLESLTSALRSADLDRSALLQSRALELLRERPVDCCERMILVKVMARIRGIRPHPSVTADLDECLAGI